MMSWDHYLTVNPTITASTAKPDAPTAMPTTTPSIHRQNITTNNASTGVHNANATTSTTPSPTPQPLWIGPSPTSTMVDHDFTNSPSATASPTTTTTTTTINPDESFFDARGRRVLGEELQKDARPHSSLETHVQESLRPTSSVTSFTSSLLSSSTASSSTSASSDGYYFDDLSLINDSRNFVYYDSKQARFGVDLGPRGNAVFVNIMLPPRLYSDDFSRGRRDLDTEQNDVDVWSNENEGRENAVNVFNDNNNNASSSMGDDHQQSNGSVAGQQNLSDIEDYFCLEDFVNWREETRRHYSSPSSAASNSIATNASAIALPQPNPADLIDATRPLTILIRRGRCTFESKAQMAVVLNEIFSNAGNSNRIDHIIIYNNGTDDDNNTDTKEGLVDMGYEGEMEGDDITVGLLYIASTSGQDLMRRIRERQISTFISPHLDVPPLSTEHNAHTLDRQLMESESNEPDWEDTDLFSDAGYHDKQISHGWWFPATLTRFCHSCGSEMHYGFVWNDDDDFRDIPRSNDGSDISPPQPYVGGYPQDYFSDWFLYIREFLIAILVLLLLGPIVVMTLRWYIVGGTFRIVTDENGVRRLRMVSPTLNEFVNGTPGTVEMNGTKLDRAQVFSLPEIEYAAYVDEENSAGCIDDCTTFNERSADHVPSPVNDEVENNITMESSTSQSTPSNASPTRSGRFISSSCCSICIDEFTLGERIRMLPRCSHGKVKIAHSTRANYPILLVPSIHSQALFHFVAFHTECILPWLTERQGCCPLCKVPVLSDELQRTRSSSRRLGSRGRL